MSRTFDLPTPHGRLHGQIALPLNPRGLILLPHLPEEPPQDKAVVAYLATRDYGLVTLPLLTPQESHFADSQHNVALLASRLVALIDHLRHEADTEHLPLILFASGHATPAAIRTAAQRDAFVQAVVGHGGLIDLAGLQYLSLLAAPLLMLFDSDDHAGEVAYQRAASHLTCPHERQRLAPGDNPAMAVAAWLGRQVAR